VSSDLLDRCLDELRQYFAGSLTNFTTPLDLRGTPFQQRVWTAVAAVPYGETVTYREIAARIGAPNAFRAVGAANGANPAAIIVPCHRIIGSEGKLHGYGGGLHQKQALLEMEAAHLHADRAAVRP
jgi:methylated-DNA-[protein]-cysteine S-methyltransferase